MAFVILSRAPVIPFTLAHSLGDVRVAIQTAIIGDTTKAYVATTAFVLVIEVGVRLRQWRRRESKPHIDYENAEYPQPTQTLHTSSKLRRDLNCNHRFRHPHCVQ